MMLPLIALLLIGLSVSQKKKCKNPVECYADAIGILEVDRELLRSKMSKCGDNANKLVEQVKAEVQVQFKEESDRRVLDLEAMVKKNTEDIKDIYHQLEMIKDKLKQAESEKESKVQDIHLKYETYKKEVKSQISNVQKNIKNMMVEQEDLKTKASEMEVTQQKQHQDVITKISEAKKESAQKIEQA